MQQLPSLDFNWNDTSVWNDNPRFDISPATYEIMQALACGDMTRATELIELQHDTDTDLQ